MKYILVYLMCAFVGLSSFQIGSIYGGAWKKAQIVEEKIVCIKTATDTIDCYRLIPEGK